MLTPLTFVAAQLNLCQSQLGDVRSVQKIYFSSFSESAELNKQFLSQVCVNIR